MQESDYPELFTVADARAKAAQTRYTRLVQIDLILLILASIFGVVENFTPPSLTVPLTILSALSLVAALSLETATRLFHLERRWYENRAVAESTKTASWRYIMRIEPFNQHDADSRFLTVLGETAGYPGTLWASSGAHPEGTRRAAGGAHLAAVSGESLNTQHQITPEMRRLRHLTFPERKEHYLTDRLADQAGWYARRSRQKQRSAAIWFWIGIASRVAALIFAILTIFLPFAGERFVELFAAVAAGATAWAELGRHEEQAKAYGNAAHELSQLAPLIESAQDERTLVARVVDAEGAMSREYTLWMVKRT